MNITSVYIFQNLSFVKFLLPLFDIKNNGERKEGRERTELDHTNTLRQRYKDIKRH